MAKNKNGKSIITTSGFWIFLTIVILALMLLNPTINQGIRDFLFELASKITISLSAILGGGNGFGTDNPPSGTLPPQYNDCTYYNFNTEFTRYLGEPNMQNLQIGCNAMGGTFTRASNEVGCDYPATWFVDCTDPRLAIFSNFCNYLHGTYICDNNLYHYIGCLCNKLPPLEPQNNNNDEEPNEYTCGWKQEILGWECYGTCPTGTYCGITQQDECKCIEEEQTVGVGTIFVTSTKWNGAFGGLLKGDEKCQVSADFAGLSGTWKVIASDSTSGAWTRIPDTTYYNMNGLLIANNKADLFDGSIANFINIDENYNNVGVQEVWTGSDENGNSFSSGDLTTNCHNWGWVSDGYFGIVGSTGDTGVGWIENMIVKECKLTARLYCMRVN